LYRQKTEINKIPKIKKTSIKSWETGIIEFKKIPQIKKRQK